MDDYLMDILQLRKSIIAPTAKPVAPKTVNVTFKACYLLETTDEIIKHPNGKTYTRTITAYNTADVLGQLQRMIFTDMHIISIK